MDVLNDMRIDSVVLVFDYEFMNDLFWYSLNMSMVRVNVVVYVIKF